MTCHDVNNETKEKKDQNGGNSHLLELVVR